VAKVTSKLQVTLPKAIADQYRIKPGDEILWVAAGDALRVIPARSLPRTETTARRLALFEAATQRQVARQTKRRPVKRGEERGWRREELYERGRSR
jgi:AbrB family looped-hinge helix DNA binding protein